LNLVTEARGSWKASRRPDDAIGSDPCEEEVQCFYIVPRYIGSSGVEAWQAISVIVGEDYTDTTGRYILLPKPPSISLSSLQS
jgi:hypothetical protein